jgi:ribosomal protein S18 acetylase RimI-like enzyme
MSDFTFRSANAADAEAIVGLATSGFQEERRKLLVYGCAGAESFVRSHVGMPATLAERRYSVAESASGDVKGIVDLVRTPDAYHLAYIAIAPSARGLGLAPRILFHAIREWQLPVSALQLDVFKDNDIALRWYDRLGFDTIAESTWYQANEIPEAALGALDAYAVGLPAANAAHAQLGFSEFTLQTPRGRYAVGRIGDGWFRLTDATAMDDPQVGLALRVLDPNRGLLVLGSTDATLPKRGFVPLVTSQRRRVTLTLLMNRLEQVT